jgi:shikimate kinase
MNGEESHYKVPKIVKVLTPILKIEPIYTGGKIQLKHQNTMYTLCNNQVIHFSMSEKKILDRITQVQIFPSFKIRKMKKSLHSVYRLTRKKLSISQKIFCFDI